jgi:hypothetical protein
MKIFECKAGVKGARKSGEALGGAGFGFGGFFFAVFGWGGGFKRVEELEGGVGDLVDGGGEGGLVGFGGLVEASDFADELEGSGADLVGSDRRIEVIESFDVAAHTVLLPRIAASVYKDLSRTGFERGNPYV